ncbi:MAG: cytochrome b/b6 domain-containing protein [Ignavibacteriales bacterium]|nr:cytochrome b/b6 domain-containing protein [Ignavibacteriales bacterium]
MSCHLDNPDIRAQISPSAGFIASYEQSVHGSALAKGNAKVANCVDCHGSHEMRKGSERLARTNRANIPATCSQCHGEIAKEYAASVHGVGTKKGNAESAVCTDCHGEHNILRHTDPKSPVAARNISAQVCSPCHSSVRLTEKYGIASDRFKTFNDSYHGLAIKGGSIEAANCASCHGSHNIKSSRDSTSTIYPKNLAETCGKCHKGANERFAMGSVHVNIAAEEPASLYWISVIYVILIVSVVGGMFIHNVADFIRKARRKLLIRRGIIAEEHVGHRLYLRMTLNERLQHAALLLSFTVLVATGFMLRYPDEWWVKWMRSVSSDVFELRSLLHRAAGVVMVAASQFHIYYILATERGKALIRDLLPGIQDAKDAVAVLKYNFGFSKIRPQFGRFSYIEKSEYWALVWGTVVMAVTGFIMWFDNTFIGLLTKLGYDISRLIHFYEAWLATLSIVIWHFYYVIFNPDVYPVNPTFFTGTLTETEMVEEHPLELTELRKAELDKHMIEVSNGANNKNAPQS